MSTDNEAARRTTKPRQPWMDELARLRWLETRVIALAADLRMSAANLRDTITGAADTTRRDKLDAAAAERDTAAEDIEGLLAAAAAGPPAATSADWAQWHLDELTHLLAGCRAPAPMASVLDEAGSPE